MKKIIDGVLKFQDSVHPEHRRRFDSLAEGQSPEVLWITCSDSRVDPGLLTQSRPGDLFVLRNAGNLIPRHGAGASAEAGTIEYAVRVVGVQHIVVCGHSRCGAMAAVLDPDSTAELPAVQAWLQLAGPRRVEGPGADLPQQIRSNVKQQIENLRTHPAVRDTEARGELRLHGWVYDFVSGEVQAMNAEQGHFAKLDATARA